MGNMGSPVQQSDSVVNTPFGQNFAVKHGQSFDRIDSEIDFSHLKRKGAWNVLECALLK